MVKIFEVTLNKTFFASTISPETWLVVARAQTHTKIVSD
jgi:hypothetical protein